jgi:hypothetical protein
VVLFLILFMFRVAVNLMESAKCFKNVPLTIAKRSQIRMSLVLHNGLFVEDPVSSVKKSASGSKILSLSKLLRSTDTVAESAVVKNTEYRHNMLIVIAVHSQDKITAGWLKKVVVRGSKVFFLVTKKECYRTAFQYFESGSGISREGLVNSEDLKCFKPLLPRGTEESYVFFLHGKLVDDDC